MLQAGERPGCSYPVLRKLVTVTVGRDLVAPKEDAEMYCMVSYSCLLCCAVLCCGTLRKVEGKQT